MKIIRIFGWFITKVFRQIYEKVVINEPALLQLQNHNQKENGPLIFMPTHRSYIDFILVIDNSILVQLCLFLLQN